MALFPTKIAVTVAKRAGIEKLFTHAIELTDAIGDFQKVAAASDFEDALVMLQPYLTRGKLSEDHITALQKIFDFTQVEIDGIVIDSIGKIMKDSEYETSKLNAAKLLYAIRNGEESGDIGEKTLKRFIFELDKSE